LGKFFYIHIRMGISKIHILPTDSTPEIILDPEGVIKIKGRGKALDNSVNFKKVMDWLDAYLQNPAEITYIKICFEYLNSFCTLKLVQIIKRISQVVLNKKKCSVHWYYEEGDEDILERGEYVSSSFDIPITFIMTNDIKDCC